MEGGPTVSLACALKNRVFKAEEIIYEHSLLVKVNNNSKKETVRYTICYFLAEKLASFRNRSVRRVC